MFERYNIVSPGVLCDAVTKLEAGATMVSGRVAPITASGAERISYSTEEKMEAPPGFEPGMEVLQTSALPLGHGAVFGNC